MTDNTPDSFLRFIFILSVCVFAAMYVCAPHFSMVPAEDVGVPELELQMVLRRHLGAGHRSQVLCKSRK